MKREQNQISVYLGVFDIWMCLRHERDSRQSPSRSGEVSKVSRQWFAGFRLKVLFSFARSSGKPISWTLRHPNGTLNLNFLSRETNGKIPSKERQCSVRVRLWKKFRSSTVWGQKISSTEVSIFRLISVRLPAPYVISVASPFNSLYTRLGNLQRFHGQQVSTVS